MASPPFSINTAIPGDSDIVSQFPLVDRTVRDVIQSWILVQHDTSGNHTFLKMPYSATPATPAASFATIFVDSIGRLKYVLPDGSVNYVGGTPGNVAFTAASSVPAGFLVADGSAVSRTTYADLFAAIGITFGAGNGTTTFNLPDIKGRVIAGEDAAAGRLTSTYFGATAVLGAVGGAEFTTLAAAQNGPHQHNVYLKDPGHTHTSNAQQANNTFGTPNTGGFGVPQSPIIAAINSNTTGLTIGSVNGVANDNLTASQGSGTGHSNVQHTIILKAIIKT